MPYQEKPHDHNVILAIANGELPARPETTGDAHMFVQLWGFCLSCWRDSSYRPTAIEILRIMSSRECTDTFVIVSVLTIPYWILNEVGTNHLAHLDLTGQISNVTYDANRGINKAIWQKRRTYVAVKAVRISMRE